MPCASPIPLPLRLLLVILGFLVASATAQESAKPDADSFDGVFVMELGGKEVGREKVSIDSEGWSAESTFDILGVQKGHLTASSRRQADGSVKFTLKQHVNGKDVTIEAVRTEKQVTGTLTAVGQDYAVDFAYDPPGLLYMDLVWSIYIDLGRYYSEQRSKNALRAGSVVRGMVPNPQGSPVLIELKEIESITQVIAGQPEPLTHYRFTLADRVEVSMVCNADGLPLRFAIPSQSIQGTLEGFESVLIPSGKGRSALDRGGWRAKLSPAAHAVVAEEKVMIPMRDGVKLASDLYRPEADGKYPTILIRTPYSRATEGLTKGDRYASRGYVVVAQDVRGRFDSEGEWYPLENEMNDGSDTIDWIAKQPWSDGQVGMIGASYVGWVQWYAAKSGNPHLKAIIPQVSPPDPTENIPYEGGAFLLSSGWWAKVLEHMEAIGGAGLPTLDWGDKLQTLPLNDLDKALGTTHPFLDDWVNRPPTDPAWDAVRYQTHYSKMNVAVLNLSGWFDGDQPGAPQNFVGMREHGPEAMRDHQYLLMGAWGHAFNLQTKLGDIDFGEEAVVDLDAIVVRFFDRYLKGADNGFDQEPPVMVFVMGANRWVRDESWPLSGTVPTKLFLGSPGRAQKVEDGGFLALEPTTGEADSFRYDPHSPRIIDSDFEDITSATATEDISHHEDRTDYLDYLSPPLETAAEITGPVRAILSVSTDAADTDFTLEVSVISKDGTERGLAAGIQRLRYRTGKDEPVPPGDVVTVDIDGWATSKRLEPGDRIRVTIGSCFLPGYARNLNTLEDPATATKGVVATNRVHHDAQHPSYLLLPIVPRRESPGLSFAADEKLDRRE